MSNYSIVIPTLAGVTEAYLKVCVESLRTSGFDGEIIVVTNGTSTPEPLNIKGITRRLHTRDQGQCNAVNIGIQNVTTEYVLISNDDMYYAPGWDENLRFNYPVFSPNLVEPSDNAGSAPPFLKFPGGLTIDTFDRENVDVEIAFMTSKKSEEETGFNFPVFIKTDLWNMIGGYDIAYDPWGSGGDTDLQMKVELAGVKPVRLRDVLVYHFGSKSGTFDGTHQDYWQNNWEYLQDKWGFNRDEAGSDTWYCKDMILWDKLKYHPSWEGKYEKN